MQVRDVAHDCRVELIELLRRNAVQRLDTDLESTTREGPKKEHDGVHEEYHSPKHHEACAIAQGLLSRHCFLLGLDDTALDEDGLARRLAFCRAGRKQKRIDRRIAAHNFGFVSCATRPAV